MLQKSSQFDQWQPLAAAAQSSTLFIYAMAPSRSAAAIERGRVREKDAQGGGG
jgi:hypothetical protein